MKHKTNIEDEDIIEDISEDTLLSLDELAGIAKAITEAKNKKKEDEDEEDEDESDEEINAELGPKDEAKKAKSKKSKSDKDEEDNEDNEDEEDNEDNEDEEDEDEEDEDDLNEDEEESKDDEDTEKTKQLKQTGLFSDADIKKVITTLKLIKDEEEVSQAQKDLVVSVFLKLVGLVTGDEDVFEKLKKTIKGAEVNSETKQSKQEESIEIDHSDITRLVESEEGLTEEFKERATIIFEAAVLSKISEIKTNLEEEYETRLSEETETIKDNLTEKIDNYLTYAVETWVEENKVAIESSLRTEIAENFITSLKSVFVEHYIEVPESKVDLFANLEAEVTKLKKDAREAERISESLAAGVITLTREKIMQESFSDLADTQVEKLKALVEDVEFVNATSYKKKIDTIKKFYITGLDKDSETLHEDYNDNAYVSTETIVENENMDEDTVSPAMSRYLTAISRSAKASS